MGTDAQGNIGSLESGHPVLKEQDWLFTAVQPGDLTALPRITMTLPFLRKRFLCEWLLLCSYERMSQNLL